MQSGGRALDHVPSTGPLRIELLSFSKLPALARMLNVRPDNKVRVPDWLGPECRQYILFDTKSHTANSFNYCFELSYLTSKIYHLSHFLFPTVGAYSGSLISRYYLFSFSSFCGVFLAQQHDTAGLVPRLLLLTYYSNKRPSSQVTDVYNV